MKIITIIKNKLANKTGCTIQHKDLEDDSSNKS